GGRARRHARQDRSAVPDRERGGEGGHRRLEGDPRGRDPGGGRPMTEVASPPIAQAAPERHWYELPGEQVAASMEGDPGRGLSAGEAAARLETYGPNKFAEGETEPRWRAFVRQYHDPMQIVLLVAGIGSIWPVKEYGTGILLLLLTVLNAVLGLNQEGK